MTRMNRTAAATLRISSFEEGLAMVNESRRIAVVDVGTNSVRLLMVEIAGDELQILDEFGDVTRLGAALARSGAIDEADADRTLAVLKLCVARAEKAGVLELDIVGTEVFRAASNGREVGTALYRDLGHPVRILSPEEEAEASYLGVVGWEEAHGPGPCLIVDIGGGSTEVILGDGVAIQFARSVPQGALRVKESFLKGDPASPSEIRAARKSIDLELESLAPLSKQIPKTARVVAVGGTACAIGAWSQKIIPYDAERIHGCQVGRDALARTIAEWSALPRAEIMRQGAISEGRASVLLGGALIVECLLGRLGAETFQVSTRGLRHGLVLKLLFLA